MNLILAASTPDAEAGGSLLIRGQCGLHNEFWVIQAELYSGTLTQRGAVGHLLSPCLTQCWEHSKNLVTTIIIIVIFIIIHTTEQW